MSLNIQFIARDDFYFDTTPRPFPASKAIPDWWKNQVPYKQSPDNPDGKKIIVRDYESNATFKKCTPMLDALTSGYIIPLMADIQVTNVGTDSQYVPYINWRIRTPLPMFDVHAMESVKIEKPSGYHAQALKYINGWNIKTPKGYSTLFISPVGYEDGPFRALTAVIDTDSTPHEIVLPVWIKNGLEGIVEKGTPMVQVIPFKRTNWEATFSHYEKNEMAKLVARDVKATIVNNYVKNFWTKKSYK